MMGNAEVFQVATSQWIYQLPVRHDAMKIIRLKGVTKYSAQIACEHFSDIIKAIKQNDDVKDEIPFLVKERKVFA